MPLSDPDSPAAAHTFHAGDHGFESRWGYFGYSQAESQVCFFRSRDSALCSASLLAEIGDCRGRYPHRNAIA
jgi:hypothetical protein